MPTHPNRADATLSAPAAKAEIDALIANGKADPMAVRTLRCRTVAEGCFRQLNYIRNLPPQPVMETPQTEGLLSEAVAPNASEALLAAFGSCLAVGIHANAVAQGIPITELAVELEADINTTAVWGAGDLNPKTIGFESVRVLVRLEADAPRKTARRPRRARDPMVARRQYAAQPRAPGGDPGMSRTEIDPMARPTEAVTRAAGIRSCR